MSNSKSINLFYLKVENVFIFKGKFLGMKGKCLKVAHKIVTIIMKIHKNHQYVDISTLIDNDFKY